VKTKVLRHINKRTLKLASQSAKRNILIPSGKLLLTAGLYYGFEKVMGKCFKTGHNGNSKGADLMAIAKRECVASIVGKAVDKIFSDTDKDQEKKGLGKLYRNHQGTHARGMGRMQEFYAMAKKYDDGHVPPFLQRPHFRLSTQIRAGC